MIEGYLINYYSYHPYLINLDSTASGDLVGIMERVTSLSSQPISVEAVLLLSALNKAQASQITNHN